MDQQEKVLELLDYLEIEYHIVNHQPVYTVEDMDELKITQYGNVCKNLFLKDAKGEKYFIVVMNKDKKVDLKSLQKQLNCTRLSFASEESLHKYLQLHKGEVSPMGIINDTESFVNVIIDNDLVKENRLGFHPNDNRSTIFISYAALEKVIKHNGNTIDFVTI